MIRTPKITSSLNLSIYLCIIYRSTGITLPVPLKDICYVDIITSGKNVSTDIVEHGEDVASLLLNHRRQNQNNCYQSYTIHSSELSFGIQMDEDFKYIEDQLTIKTGYFRFLGKLRKQGVLVVLLPETFNETLVAIQNSGYATSNAVMLFIRVRQVSIKNPVIHELQETITSPDPEITPFYPTIIFFESDSRRIGLFCYFCPEGSDKLFVHDIPSELTLESIILQFAENQLRDGHGRRVQFSLSQLVDETDICLVNLPSKRADFYHQLEACGTPEIVVVSSFMPLMNLTAVLSNLPDEETAVAKWMLTMFVNEVAVLSIPNVIAYTRGGYHAFGKTPLELIGCVSSQSQSKVDFFLGSIFVPQLWLAILAVAFTLAYVYKNLPLGIDIIWILVGWGTWYEHPRHVTGFIFIPIAIVTYTYHAHVSTDLMQLATSPTTKELFTKNFQIWFDPGKPGKSLILSMFEGLPTPVKLAIENGLGGLTLADILFDDEPIPRSSTITLVETLVSTKRFLWASDHIELLHGFGKGLKYIHETILCRVMDFSTESNLGIAAQGCWRVWGYLSSRMLSFQRIFFEAGVYEQAIKLHTQGRRVLKGLNMEQANGFLKPPTMNLKSTVGLSALYLFIIQCAILLMWIIWQVSVRRENITRNLTLTKSTRVLDIPLAEVYSQKLKFRVKFIIHVKSLTNKAWL